MIFKRDFGPIEAVYRSAYDADTLRLDLHPMPEDWKINTPIRLIGINCPELRSKNKREKALAYEARDYVREFLEHADSIEVTLVGFGKYRRLLAEVVVNGANLNTLLQVEGYAVPYDGGTKRAWL